MLNRIFQSDKNYFIFSFLSGLLFVYIILFEFILPVNGFLPKPSILIDSLPSLIKDYNFFQASLITFSAIYSIMLISYASIKIGNSILIKVNELLPDLRKLLIIGKYFIPLYLIFLFNLWFGSSIWAEYMFILIIVMGSLKSKMISEFNQINEDYITAAKSLGISKKEIESKIIWKSIQPKVYDTFMEFHSGIWGYVIIYEYVCNTAGIGTIFNIALKYNDLSVVLLLIIILMATIILMELIMRNVKRKYFFWS